MNDSEEETTLRKCCACDETLENRCILSNIPSSQFPDTKTFVFMDMGQSIHLECYIQRVMQHLLKRNEEK